MNLTRKKRNRYKFTEKKHSKKGIAAFIAALVILALYIVFLILAFRGNGSLSTYYGSAGVFAMLGAVITLILAIQSMREENSFQFFPRLALLVSFFASVCWISTYVMGFYIIGI